MNNSVLVFGASGKVGRNLVPLLKEKYDCVLTPIHQECDLLELESVRSYLEKWLPNSIINLAAKTTTMSLNKTYPADISYETLLMNMNILELSSGLPIKKLINVVSSCAYANNDILVEDRFLDGPIHPSVLPHGSAKRQVYILSKHYKDQYNLPVTCVCFNNICGSEYWANPDSLKVLSALVKKFVDAVVNNSDVVEIWGTGVAWREFIHAKDAAVGLLTAFEQYDGDLINIGTGEDIQISALADLIKYLTGFKGRVAFKGGQDGQLVKQLSTKRMREYLGDIHFHGPVMIADKVIREYKQYLKDMQP